MVAPLADAVAHCGAPLAGLIKIAHDENKLSKTVMNSRSGKRNDWAAGRLELGAS